MLEIRKDHPFRCIPKISVHSVNLSQLKVYGLCLNNQEPKERKSLDDRARKMTDLERIRHSCAHVLATAILQLWPEAQFAAGPPVENGFYYDVELSHRISPEDFGKIEAEMKKETKANHVTFEKILRHPREQALQGTRRADAWAAWPNAPATRASSRSAISRTSPKARRFRIIATAISSTSARDRT